MKKFVLTIIIIIIIATSSLSLLIIKEHNDNYNWKKEDTSLPLTKEEKEILNIEQNELEQEKEENYSKEYQEYLKLSKKEKEKIEAIPRKEEVPLAKLDEIIEKEEIKKEIPSKFDLRDVIDIEVDDQESYGLCWAFASNKTLETNLSLNTNKNYDLSEIHIDYITSNLMYGNRQIHYGGDFGYFKNYFLITGATIEEENEYREHTVNEYSEFLNRESVAIVTDTVDFPSIYKGNNEITNEELNKFRNLVKTHIMTNGAIYAGIGNPSFLNYPYNSYYCDKDCYNNGRHAVAIVGWDDNFKKENFKSYTGNIPKNNGAYIAINSWGEAWGENGYFYISYEDMYVESDMSGVISTSIEDAIKVSDIKSDSIRELVIEKFNYSFINYNNEDYVTKIALNKIMTLDLSNKNLNSTDLEDLHIFNNLVFLNLSNNNIDDITALSKLNSLSFLDLSNNNITDVTILKNIPYLATLDLSNNLNVKGYGALITLTSLTLKNTNTTNLEDLSNHKELFSLYLSNNKNLNLNNYLPTKLGILDLSDCNLDDLSSIEGANSSIRVLDLSNNNLTNLEDISKFPNLENLNLSNNKNIDDYSNLKDLKEFNILIVENNDLEDISIFNDLNLFELDLSYNNITDLSQFNIKELNIINLSGNKNLTNLDKLKDITAVTLNDCNITNLDNIIALENVNRLELSYNNITDISLLNKLSNLRDLSLEGNQNLIGTLSNNIYTLDISNTNLTDFDISKLKQLSSIDISNNNNFDVINLIKNKNYEFLNIDMENVIISNNVLEVLNSNEITLNDAIIEFNIKIDENKKLSLFENEWLKNFVTKNILTNEISMKNGIFDKKNNTIEIKSLNEFIELEFKNYYYNGLLSPNIKIIIN